MRECGIDSSGGLFEHVNKFSYTIIGGEFFDSMGTVSFLVSSLFDGVSYVISLKILTFSCFFFCLGLYSLALLLFQSLLFLLCTTHPFAIPCLVINFRQ